MKLVNIVNKLQKDGFEVVPGEFDFKRCLMCEGTALVDVIDEVAVDTCARYSDVVEQILNNRSHIFTGKGKTKRLTAHCKLGY